MMPTFDVTCDDRLGIVDLDEDRMKKKFQLSKRKYKPGTSDSRL
jgi:hypothetical protein